jgi:hypothetical protein
MERDRREPFSSEHVEDKVWGDSEAGPGGEGFSRDPWSGTPVVDEEPDARVHEPVGPQDAPEEDGVVIAYVDEGTGGDAGLVNDAPAAVKSGFGPGAPDGQKRSDGGV